MARKRCKARVFPQLVAGVPTAGEDCGVRTTQRALHWASCGKVRVPVSVLRKRMGKPSGPTNPPDWYDAMTHPDTKRQFRQAGLQPPRVGKRGLGKTGLITGSPVKTAIDALGDGKMICVAESYAPWHDTRWSGSSTFGTSYRDNHAVSYLGITGKPADTGGDGRTSVRYDSLADGRAPGIATGPNVVPWHIVTDAMGDLELSPRNATRDPLGDGQWCGLVVSRALPLDPDNGGGGGPVDPPPPTTCEEQLASLQAQHQALQADYDRLDDAVDAAQVALADIATALEAAQGVKARLQAKAAKAALDLAVDDDPPEVSAAVPVVSGVDVLRAPADDVEDDE